MQSEVTNADFTSNVQEHIEGGEQHEAMDTSESYSPPTTSTQQTVGDTVALTFPRDILSSDAILGIADRFRMSDREVNTYLHRYFAYPPIFPSCLSWPLTLRADKWNFLPLNANSNLKLCTENYPMITGRYHRI